MFSTSWDPKYFYDTSSGGRWTGPPVSASDVNEPDFFELEPSRAFSTQAEPSSSLARISSFELNFAKKGRKLAV